MLDAGLLVGEDFVALYRKRTLVLRDLRELELFDVPDAPPCVNTSLCCSSFVFLSRSVNE